MDGKVSSSFLIETVFLNFGDTTHARTTLPLSSHLSTYKSDSSTTNEVPVLPPGLCRRSRSRRTLKRSSPSSSHSRSHRSHGYERKTFTVY